MFSMVCSIKNCHKQMEPYIDPKNDKVYCSICDGELTNVTHFVKIQMKTAKQYRQKSSIAFGIKCNLCGKEARPIVVNKDIVCPLCKKAHTNLSEPFKIMLREHLKNFSKDIE